MKTRTIAVFILTLSIGCQNVKENNSSQKNVNYKNEVFSNRNKQKENFLFLDFWSNMSNKEYHIICDSLINEEILKNDTSYIDINNYSTKIINTIFVINTTNNNNSNDNIRSYHFFINPHFIDDKLVNISLSTNLIDSTDCNSILRLYKDKYGDLTMKTSKKESYIKTMDPYNENVKKNFTFAEYYPYISYIRITEKYVVEISKNFSLFQSKDFKGKTMQYHRLSSLNINYISKTYYYLCEEEKTINEKKEKQLKEEKIQKSKELI